MRKQVLKDLLRLHTPIELAKAHGVAPSAISRAILALEKVGLVECLTPTENRDRYYRTTDAGKKFLRLLRVKGNNLFFCEYVHQPLPHTRFFLIRITYRKPVEHSLKTNFLDRWQNALIAPAMNAAAPEGTPPRRFND